ncbi:MAG: M2 family metallopeptidase, partial [Planctomycetes bacterium]|nr:M2 family metallopeptidase [Planctomycetota bacterium]
MKKLIVFVLVGLVFCGCRQQLNVKELQLQDFIDKHVEMVEPMYRDMALAYWVAATTGKAEEYAKVSEYELKLRQVYSDADDYAMLKEMKESGAIEEPLLARHVDVLHNGYLENQIDSELMKQIVELGNDIDRQFSTFRGTIDGETVTDNEIKEILKSETDLEKREKAWLASKQVGIEVADDLVRLVKLRNEAAEKLGYENYHTLSLTMSEQDVGELDKIFAELYELTKGPFGELKVELDGILAGNFGIAVGEMEPWHYHDPFFQETPLVY